LSLRRIEIPQREIPVHHVTLLRKFIKLHKIPQKNSTCYIVQRIPNGKQNSEIKMRLITNLDLMARYS
jgi:hypothetical protein